MTADRKNPRRYLTDLFDRVWRWARARSRRVPRLRLHVGCGMTLRHRRADPRAFFHVDHHPGKVCTVPAAAGLPVENLVALFLHEIGHPLARRAWGRSEQEDADKAVLDVLGVRLRYRGPLLLEWVPPAIARRILSK